MFAMSSKYTTNFLGLYNYLLYAAFSDITDTNPLNNTLSQMNFFLNCCQSIFQGKIYFFSHLTPYSRNFHLYDGSMIHGNGESTNAGFEPALDKIHAISVTCTYNLLINLYNFTYKYVNHNHISQYLIHVHA